MTTQFPGGLDTVQSLQPGGSNGQQISQTLLNALHAIVAVESGIGVYGGLHLGAPFVIDAVGLLQGEQELIHPAAGKLFGIAISAEDFEASDGDMQITAYFPGGLGTQTQFLSWSQGDTINEVIAASLTANGTAMFIADGSQELYAVLNAVQTGTAVITAPGVWDDLHAYAQGAMIIAAGHLWEVTVAGTSDAVIPDFAGNIGGDVTDGTVTWEDQGAIPTQGLLTVYPLTN